VPLGVNIINKRMDLNPEGSIKVVLSLTGRSQEGALEAMEQALPPPS